VVTGRAGDGVHAKTGGPLKFAICSSKYVFDSPVDCRDHLRITALCQTDHYQAALLWLIRWQSALLARVHRSGFVDCSVLQLIMGCKRRRIRLSESTLIASREMPGQLVVLLKQVYVMY